MNRNNTGLTIRRQNGRLVALFTVAGAAGAAAILPYQFALSGQTLQGAAAQAGLPPGALIGLSVLQTAVQVLIASWLGLLMARSAGLDAPMLRSWMYRTPAPAWSGRWLTIAIAGSFLLTLLLALTDKLLLQPYLPPAVHVAAAAASHQMPLWSRASTALYGGVVEEVLLRLFVMTLLVWILSIPARRSHRPIAPAVYVCAIVLATLLFGFGHLPATASLFGGLSGLLVVRALVLNGLLGLLFGWLYWKKGLEYAIVSHLFADLFLHVLWASALA
ncbi:CPBP family glutamic-type intramembrane protease [Paenibacillus sp. y28]|uniref:CPBP family glutamic-type intramembrane protease n=1 Tax=Paenibacillus sp. y28 TaxID=3129110 RepID=UPI0030171D7C